MTHVQKMRDYIALAESAMNKLRALTPVIQREMERRYGQKLKRARTKQEEDNLRRYYTREVSKENMWRQDYADDRDLYIRLATMYGIAAQVEAEQPIGQIHPRGMYP